MALEPRQHGDTIAWNAADETYYHVPSGVDMNTLNRYRERQDGDILVWDENDETYYHAPMPGCVPIIGTVNSGTIVVPEGVTSGSHYFVAYVLGPYADWVGGSVTEPTGLDPYNSDGYNTGVEQQTQLYEPFLHDGRSSYVWTGFSEISIVYAFVPCASGYNSGGYDYFVDWAYSYPTFQNPKTGRDPMFWGDFYPDDPNWNPESKIFVGVWSARDEDNSRVLIGMVVEPPQAQYVGTEHWENLYTLPWPGSNTNNSEYDWTTDGFILDKAV